MTKTRMTSTLACVCGLLLCASACKTTEEQKTAEDGTADVEEELREAAEAARKEIEHAGEKIEHAAKEGAEEVREGAHEVREGADELGRDVSRTANELGLGNGKYERFAAYEKESVATFAARADTAITALQADLEAARSKVEGEPKGEVKMDLERAENALKEARKDLVEVRTNSGATIDDGRLGVAVNINEAQRRLATVQAKQSES